MGIHEWLLQRGKGYEVDDELRTWLACYRDESERSAKHCDRFTLAGQLRIALLHQLVPSETLL